MRFRHGHTVQVIRGGGRNRDGDRLEDRRFSISGVALAPTTHTTPVDRVDQQADASTDWTLYSPSQVDLKDGDHVEYEGRRWRVDGDPQTWTFVFFRGTAGVVATLKEVQASGQI